LEFEREILNGCEGIKPGWVRVNFNYFIDDAVADYIIEAIHLVARHGATMLPCYRFEPASGLWVHRDGNPTPPMSLRDIRYDEGVMVAEERRLQLATSELVDYLTEAEELMTSLAACPPEPLELPDMSADFEGLRWFPYPSEARA
jgi:hypothetical protein